MNPETDLLIFYVIGGVLAVIGSLIVFMVSKYNK